MSKKKQIGYSLIVWETLKEYNEETKWYEPTKNKRVEVAQLLSEELSDNEDVKSKLLDELFGYKDNIKEMLKNNEFTEIPDYHKEELEKDQKIADLEAKLAEKDKLLREKIGSLKINDFIKLCLDCGFMVDAKDKDNQDKISFAVEQLEKAKEYIKTNLMSFQKVPIIQEINNQIKQLKEK